MAPLTGDEERFYRLARIILDDVPNQLRTLFKDKFQERFKFAWGDNQMSGEFFINNFRRAPLPHIADVIRQGDTAQFDPTALFTCLLYSGTGILEPRPRGPNARTPPVQDSERIDELREIRNGFAHANSASLSPADFSQKLASLNTIYAQLNWNPTLMGQWATGPVVTADSLRLQNQLDRERRRFAALDVTVQAVKGMCSQIYIKLC